MSLSSGNSVIAIVASAAQINFNYPYEYFDSTDLKLSLTSILNGEVSEPLFTISPTNGDTANGADIVLQTPASEGDIITISRVVPFTQQYDLKNGSTIEPTALNKAFDRAIAQNQQQEASLKRSLTHPTSDPVDNDGNPTLNYTASSVSQRAGKAVGYDTEGNITELSLLETGTVTGDALKGIDVTSNIISAKLSSDSLEFDNTGNIKVKDSVKGNFDKPIVRWNGTTGVVESTISSAITNSSSGDIIYLKNGTYTEDINMTSKTGITIIGSGSGEWNGSTYVGGTIIKGTLRWSDSAHECSLKHLAFTPNNSSESTTYNLAFLGGVEDHDVNFNSHLEDIAFYGDGYCAHNVEFRGKKWYCNNIRSYKAGIHNFPIKCADSVFRNIVVDNAGVAGASFIFIKGHMGGSSANYGTPSNTILDGFQIIMSGNTSYRGIFMSNSTEIDTVVDNVQIRNGVIINTTSTNADCIGIQGRSANNNIIKNTTIENVSFTGGTVGINIYDGQHSTNGSGVEGVYIRNCTFINPTGTTSSRYAVNNGNSSPAFGVVVSNICLREYPDNQTVKQTSAAVTETADIFTIGTVGNVVFAVRVDMDSTFTATEGTISAKDSDGIRTFTSNSDSTKTLIIGAFPTSTLTSGQTYRIKYKSYAPQGQGTTNIEFGGALVADSKSFGAGLINFREVEITGVFGITYKGETYTPNSEGVKFNIYDSSSSRLSSGNLWYIKDFTLETPTT